MTTKDRRGCPQFKFRASGAVLKTNFDLIYQVVIIAVESYISLVHT